MLISRYVSYVWLVSNYLKTYLFKTANNSHLPVSMGHKFPAWSLLRYFHEIAVDVGWDWHLLSDWRIHFQRVHSHGFWQGPSVSHHMDFFTVTS